MVPLVTSEIDSGYLTEALERAGQPSRVVDLEVRDLTAGRMGATVKHLMWRNGATQNSAVLKVLPAHAWREDVMEGAPGSEAALWLAGVTRDLPPELGCPVIDVTRHRDNGAWWMLMRDVSSGIRPRGAFGEADERTFIHALAQLHARYWSSDVLERLPLATMEGTTRIFAEPVVRLAHGESAVAKASAWVRDFISDIKRIRDTLPRFLDWLSPDDADFYLELAEARYWLAELRKGPQTLVHGDLQQSNIAFLHDRVWLIDWEFAARGPAATDLAWYGFLHLWADPSSDRVPDAFEALKTFYLERLDLALGEPIDRRQFDLAWDFAWLRVIVQLGYRLADVDVGDKAAVESARFRARAAMARARDVCDRRLP